MKTKKPNLTQQQILKKLSHIKNPDELKKIYFSVQSQNNTLRNDILDLKYKIQLLLQRQKNQKESLSKDDEAKSQQVSIFKTQLTDQYKIMHQLKKRKELSSQDNGTEQLNQQQKNMTNRIKIIQAQLGEAKIQQNDLMKEFKRLEKAVEIVQEEQKRNEPKMNQFSGQNTELKRKIYSMKKLGFQKQYQSVKIMNSMYTVKDKFNKNEEIYQQIEKKKLSVNLNQKKQPTLPTKGPTVDLNQLQKQVQSLKQQVRDVEKDQLKKSSLALKKKQDLIQENKQVVQVLKELQQKRNRADRQLNKNKKIWQKYLQNKNNSKKSKEYIATQAQVKQPEDLLPLRREYAGVLGGKITFDDRLALGQNKKSYITGFIVYEMEHNASARHHLIGIRAIYDDPQASKLNQLPIPGFYLAKCKTSKYMLIEGDFVKLFKVKYHSTEGRILKVQIRSNKNNKYEFGDKKPFNDLVSGENVYAFDISIQQYPVSLFGSYNNIRSQWYLESLGVEINDL